jgi:hypothetical protein
VIISLSCESRVRGFHPNGLIPGNTGDEYQQNRDYGCMANRTKELLMARKALCAAATIHITTLLMLFACLAVPLHAVYEQQSNVSG